MECLDITVEADNKSLRLVSIYRPPPSTKNNLSSSMFFNDFSRLMEVEGEKYAYILLDIGICDSL